MSLALGIRYPPRIAFLAIFLGGWALLPAAHYGHITTPFPYWILGNCLPSDYFLTKATISGFCGLLCLLLFYRDALRRFRLTLWDLPMLMWCVAPLLSGIANALPTGDIASMEAYQTLAWGVPYLIGRLYFSDTGALRIAAQAFVLAGLVYVPICIYEIIRGPHLYEHLYGYLPFQWIGANRYIGFRPIGLLENGNQLGIWMATSALIATWLWAKRIVTRVARIPVAWAAMILLLTTFACQSAGSVLLLIALLPFVFVSHRTFPRAIAILFIFGIMVFAGLRLTNVVSLHRMVREYRGARDVEVFLKKIGRGSLGWRLSQDERHVSIALERPVLGYGEWDWWRRGTLRPWGLWLLGFGMFGILGLLALEMLQFVPVIRAIWFPMARSDIEYLNLRHALAAAILLTAVDNLLNNAMILPLLLIIGGMSTWESAASEVQVSIETTEVFKMEPEVMRPQEPRPTLEG
ncbi:hypothetical protein [Silvibacterium dinghuense]|uniref:O-antigen ligase domain-containing protein n=1 Tax=Silvibacterium dinghuense TaxID=1560006 RepID=A0A4Q1SHU0_9BACT|nr:hypothetical protein [Silvibacterium dinghuense]RXS96740.1 hypothetical protein ESZ00_01975 [Silvibacterium dinghuense]GGG93277.1 hypothetical protein GCM10011586_05000 [Silvibacterium dinghuense]